MSETERKVSSPVPSLNTGNTLTTILQQPPQVCRMLRSPSHESVTTDLSLFSVLSIASDITGNRLVTFKSYNDVHLSRGPSPNPDSAQAQGNRPPDIPEVLWFEEENELIRSCGALSSALGLQKSFSTSDISQLPSADIQNLRLLRQAESAIALDSIHRGRLLLLEQTQFDRTSRSCSTWVAAGDIASTSQLPSPHGGANLQPPVPQQLTNAPFTAADLVRSVNKKARQNYIRRRLLTTYRALERLSQSEFNLDRLEAAASAAQANPGVTLTVPGTSALSTTTTTRSSSLMKRKNKDHHLTVRDIERERGKQLSKYERNMMIFNWLHTLEENGVDSIQEIVSNDEQPQQQ